MLMWSRVSCRKNRGSSNSEITHGQIIPFGRAGGRPLATVPPVVDEPEKRQGMPFKLFGILLLLPAIVVLSPPILIALLIIFVIWLVIVGSMAVTHRHVRRGRSRCCGCGARCGSSISAPWRLANSGTSCHSRSVTSVLQAIYHVRSDARSIEDRARAIAVEQSVEMPVAAIDDDTVLVGYRRPRARHRDLGHGLFEVRVALAAETVGERRRTTDQHAVRQQLDPR